jgi:MFS family permease
VTNDNSDPATSIDALPSVQRAAYWSLGLLITINLLNYVDRYVLAAVAPRIQRDLFEGKNEQADYWLTLGSKWGIFETNAEFWMGMLATAFLVSYMAASPLFGWLADRVSRWKIVGASLIVWSLASGASGLAATYGMLLASRLMIGVGEAAYGPVAPTLIADQFPVARRGVVLSYFYMAIPVGGALGFIVGGLVADSLSWHWAFLLSAPPGIALGIVALFMRDPPRGLADQTQVNRPARFKDYLTFLRTPSYLIATAGMTAWTFATGGIAFWMPTYVSEFRGECTLPKANLYFGMITVVTGISATFLGGWVADRVQRRWPGSYFLVSGCGTLLAVPLFLAMLKAPFPLAWLLIFLTEFCLFFNTGPANAILANVTHPAVRASAFAFNILIIHLLGDALSMPLIGKITGMAGGDMNVSFAVVSAVMTLGGVVWLCGAPYLGRDTELAPTRIQADD